MGHCPANPQNLAKLKGETEIIRPHSKCFINMGSKTTRERAPQSIASTMMGFYTLQAVSASQEELAMARH
jgi:hypothetical protein